MLELTENDLKEIFALFTSATKFEREQAYDKNNAHHFLAEDLSDEYELTEEKREFAFDAWRAVISFLYSKGYSLSKDGEAFDLSISNDLFLD